MPESYGKRQRATAKAKKIAAREERRLERRQRDADRAAGVIESGAPIEANDPEDVPPPKPRSEDASEASEERPADE